MPGGCPGLSGRCEGLTHRRVQTCPVTAVVQSRLEVGVLHHLALSAHRDEGGGIEFLSHLQRVPRRFEGGGGTLDGEPYGLRRQALRLLHAPAGGGQQENRDKYPAHVRLGSRRESRRSTSASVSSFLQK